MRAWLACALLFAACSGAADGGSCEGALPIPYGDVGQSCTACLQSSCGDETSAAFGASWASQRYGGACASYTACLCRCAVRDVDCEIGCAADKSRACLDAIDRFGACEDQSCAEACSVPNGDAGEEPDAGS